MADISYVPGPLTAVAGDQCWVLVEASPDSPAVTRIWQQFAQGAAADALLVSLLADGIGGAPGFALLTGGTDGRHRVFCRGAVGATVVPAAAAGDLPPGEVSAAEGRPVPDRIDGAGLLTWREHVVTRADRVFLGEPPADTALRLPAASGVLLAGCVIIDFTNFAVRETMAYSPPQPEDRPKKTIVLFPDTITLPPPDDISQAQAQAPVAAGQARPEGRERGTVPVRAVNGAAGGPSDAAGGPNGSYETMNHGRLDDVPDTGGEYDFFWGATQMRTVEDAAIRKPGDDGPLPPSPFARDAAPAGGAPWTGGLPGGPPPVLPVDPSPPARLWQGPDDPVQRGGMPPGPPQAGTPLPGPPSGLIDVPQWLAGPGESGSTVKRGDLPEPAVMTAPPDRIGPVVPALICPSGHLNPPNDAACRRCGAPLPHDPVPVPRPVLGVLRLSLGDVITLDRGVVMGRSPRTDFGSADGEERPHVVKLPNTGGDVSRTHLSVALDGWHVLVTDLNSTNGTLVTLPGRDPQQLRPGEPVPIQPGTVVTLAEGIDFRYEVTD